MNLEDNELVARSHDGDIGAFNMIVERYQSYVLNLSTRILGSRARRKMSPRRRLSPPAGLSAGSGGAVFEHGCCESRRTAAAMCSARPDDDERTPSTRRFSTRLFRSPQAGSHRSRALSVAELAAEIQRAILSLPEDQRATLVLVDVQGLGYEEASEAMGISLGTIKSRLSRGRARARDYLAQHRELLPEEFRQYSA